MKKKIYIAGPLFSEAERSYNLLIDTLCREEGFDTFLPQRDAPVLGADNKDEVFYAELRANSEADLIVANLDGVDVDSGTAWELGYAVAQHKQVIGVHTDWRRHSACEAVNLMIEHSAFIVKDSDELRVALRAFLAEHNGQTP